MSNTKNEDPTIHNNQATVDNRTTIIDITASSFSKMDTSMENRDEWRLPSIMIHHSSTMTHMLMGNTPSCLIKSASVRTSKNTTDVIHPTFLFQTQKDVKDDSSQIDIRKTMMTFNGWSPRMIEPPSCQEISIYQWVPWNGCWLVTMKQCHNRDSSMWWWWTIH